MISISPNSDDGDHCYAAQNSSQSSMSSLGRCSSFSGPLSSNSTELSANEQCPCSRLRLPSRPHRSSEPAWAAIRSQSAGTGGSVDLGPRDFKLVRRIGSGDLGTVYLCHLRSCTESLYAMKIVDKAEIAKKNKLARVEAERRVLRILDHPFLPTLYAEFEAAPHFSCVVVEYCSGGDLHALRHQQPRLQFSVEAVRFYAAEVLLALEYLHMLGIVYRDLKPENILIRSNGHIMLSDFDLSLESTSSSSMQPLTSTILKNNNNVISFQPTCMSISRLFGSHKSRRSTSVSHDWTFVAEPISARSRSFVGTHEYVAPEMASGQSDGSSIDWWAYGILLYELLYGRTPFVDATNDATLRNIIKRPLIFPPLVSTFSSMEPVARDLINGLLVKDPTRRLGSMRGAADIKTHNFFKGLNFALLRSSRPPYIPGLNRTVSNKPDQFDYY